MDHHSRALVAFVLLAVVAVCAPSSKASPAQTARNLLDKTGVKGGLVVHIGCGDGKLTAALHRGDGYVVHGLSTSARHVRKARSHIQEEGVYGPVSVGHFDGKRLPYASNLVNMLVMERPARLSQGEAMRVLAPRGVLLRKKNGEWQKTVKPTPDETDEWTHFLHDADGNAVASDTRIGPPRHTRWVSEPRHTRSHEHTPSIEALVSAGGRMFYIADTGPVGSVLAPPRWNIMARDAYNGTLLWKRPMKSWLSQLHLWGRVRTHIQRRLVATEERVYTTLGYHSPVSALDAGTGEVVRTYEKTRGAEEILLHRRILLVARKDVTKERRRQFRRWRTLSRKEESPVFSRESAESIEKSFWGAERKASNSIVAVEAGTGELLWKVKKDSIGWLRPLTLCASGDSVVYQDGKEVVCLDLRTGRERWSRKSVRMRLVARGRVVCVNDNRMELLSLKSGRPLWSRPTVLKKVRDAFVIDESLWLGGFGTGKDWQGRPNPAWGPFRAAERDLDTGKLLQEVRSTDPGHHHRCYRNKATARYLLSGRRGVEFTNLKTGDFRWHNWIRGVCKYGVMPANGLLYVPPNECGCYISTKLEGFVALASDPAAAPRDSTSEPDRLEPGPAYNVDEKQDAGAGAEEWPSYRHGPRRSAATEHSVPAKLKVRWQTSVGEKLTAPTVANGKVFVASVDRHRVSALDARTGRPAWHRTAGGRVDSPPTIYKDRAIYGSRDGRVYSVRTSDGVLDWRLRTGDRRRIMVRGQLESASPVHGSVLMQDGAVCFTAGRCSYLEGGIELYRVRPEDGDILSTTSFYSPDPETGRQPEQYGPAHMPGQRSDILTADSEYMYLRDKVFNKDGSVGDDGNPHLLTLTGFLDDSGVHRSYWIFGTKCSLSTGCSGQDNNLIYGRLLAFTDDTIYGYGRKRVHWSNQLQDGPYRLYAMDRDKGKVEWSRPVPLRVRALILADDVLFAAGTRNVADAPGDGVVFNNRGVPTRAGKSGSQDDSARLLALSAETGKKVAQQELDAAPAWNGMAAACGSLYITSADGTVTCMEGARRSARRKRKR